MEGPLTLHFFQRLGNVRDRHGRRLNGVETLGTHLEHMAATGADATWFCTDSLARGMSRQRLAQFRAAIAAGGRPMAYFMVGPLAGGQGEIGWSAEIVDVFSDPWGMPCPETDLYPPCWSGFGRTWLKLQGLGPCRDRTLADFVIAGTGENLHHVVRRSQYKCGYIRYA